MRAAVFHREDAVILGAENRDSCPVGPDAARALPWDVVNRAHMHPPGVGDAGNRRRGEGTGLGLPLTKALAEANRAGFAMSSTPGEGTLVEISFPPQRVLTD